MSEQRTSNPRVWFQWTTLDDRNGEPAFSLFTNVPVRADEVEYAIVRADDYRRLVAAHETSGEHHGLDNARQVFFYEQDYYVLSNFSAFMIQWGEGPTVYPTAEHAYHWCKFPDDPLKQRSIQVATSAHSAFKMAERWKQYRRPDWDDVKVGIMRTILRAKAAQHEYVARKLEATGDRELIENSWRDDFWGWGPNRDGQNMLGRLWMEIRAERRALKTFEKPSAPSAAGGLATEASATREASGPATVGAVPPICPTCKTELAWENDVCGLCNPVAQP